MTHIVPADLLNLSLTGVPPSLNKAYVTTSGGKRFLSTIGKKYKLDVKQQLLQHMLPKIEPNKPLALEVQVFFDKDAVFCKSWPKSASPFRKMDATNRIKLLEDVLCEVLGYDDSQHFQVTVVKTFSRGTEPWTSVSLKYTCVSNE